MSTSSSEPLSTAEPASRGQSLSGESALRNHVVELADRSQDQGEFFRNLVEDLQTHFGAAAVMIRSSEWSEPIVHSKDAILLDLIDTEVMEDLLATATPAPVSCDVPLTAEATIESPRALRVELSKSPHRVTVLLIYARHHRPSALRQVDDLKQLQLYAATTRAVIPSLPITAQRSDSRIAIEASRDLPGEINKHRALSGFHRSLDLPETCYRIANDTRRMLGCDRVTVLIANRRRFRVNSVSGVAVVDRRSNTIVALEKLIKAAAVLDRQLTLPSDELIPPQVQEPFDDYQDESGVCSVILVPIHAPGLETAEAEGVNRKGHGQEPILGMLVLESFTGLSPAPSASVIEAIAGEAGLSLRNVLEHRQVFGLTCWKAIGRVTHASRLPLWLMALAATLALITTGFYYRVEHHVVATGTVEPVAKREVFASIDGTVSQLHVHDGQQVKQGELLMQLENPELENRSEALAGQILTTAGRLASIQAVRLSARDEASQSSQLVLQERQLDSELANLRAQQEVLKLQLAQLSVTSPIDGTVVAWQIERRLMGRPVSRGNLLCSVTQHDGPWKLRLTVPEREAGPIVDAAQHNPQLPVRFAVATLPQQTFQAKLDDLSFAARLDESGTRVIDLNATVEHGPSNATASSLTESNLRVGADVTARIACGKRTLIRSWFSDVFDFVNLHILFHFR